MLPIALEDATKVIQAFQLAGKEYICVMRLHGEVPEEKIRKVFEEFVGEIYQRPPVRASVKRRLRTRRIYHLELLEIEDRNVLFRVGCEGGTYIRKLCYDIGEVLGCSAHMRELRRIRAGPLTEETNCVDLYDISYYCSLWKEKGDDTQIRKIVMPMEKALEFMPKIYIRDSAVDAICHGANLAAPGVVSVETEIEKGDTVAIFTLKGEAVALATALATTDEILKMTHGFVAKTRRVLMPRGIYPKMWRKESSV